MKKFIAIITATIFLVVSCIPAIPVYAADSYDYTDKEFTIKYDDDLYFQHHSDGTCDILNGNRDVVKTMTASETEHKFIALNITFDKYGNVSIQDDLLQRLIRGTSLMIGAAGDVTKTSKVVDDFRKYVFHGADAEHTVAYQYATDTMQNATVSDNGTITLSSDAIKQIYSILDEYFPRPVKYAPGVKGFYISVSDQDEKTLKQNIYNLISSAYKTHNETRNFNASSLSSEISRLFDSIYAQGYDTIYLWYNGYYKCLEQIYCFKSDSFKYYVPSSPYFYDADGLPCTPEYLRFAFNDMVNHMEYDDNGNLYYAAVDDDGNVCWDFLSYSFSDIENFSVPANYSYRFIHLSSSEYFNAFKSVQMMNKYLTGDVKGYTTTSFDSGKLPATVSISPDDMGNISGLYDEMLKELEKSNDYDAVFEKYLHELTYRANSIDDTLNNGAVDWRLRNIIEWLEKINSTLNSGFNSMYSIKDDLKDIKKGIKDIGKDVASLKTISQIDLFLNALNTIDSASNKSKISSSRDDLTTSYNKLINNKFPFSTLRDLYYIFVAFSATPKTPEFIFDINIPFLDYKYSVTTDLSAFNKLATMSRDFIIILYIIYLANKTQKLFFNGKGVK